MKSAVQMVFGGPYSAGASRHRRPFLIAKMMPLIIRLSSIRRICVADSQIKALMAALFAALLNTAERSLYDHFEQFTWLYASRISFDANALYSGSDMGQWTIQRHR